MRSGEYTFLDREAKGADPEDIYRRTFGCDTFFCSSNAITEAGELYNVDGRGNRVAAMIYGPKSVIVVAAPANAIRLSTRTPCAVLGACRDCHSDDRICCNYVVMGQQLIKGRVKVIIVGETLGF